MSESEPPPPPAPPPPNDRLPHSTSLFTSLLADEDEEEEDGDNPICSRDLSAPTWQDDMEIDWQERCFQLGMALHRFRDQTARIREVLQDKLADLERKVAEAERRAEEAEERALLMEKRLQDAGVAHDQCDVSVPSEMAKLQHVCTEKDRVITTLEQQVDEQKKLRVQDAKKVEAKAAKIKEWVANKLKELEEQNQHLREQNQKCNEQLELLRNRLSQLAQLSPRSRRADRSNTEDSSRGSWEDHGSSDDGLLPEIPRNHALSTSNFKNDASADKDVANCNAKNFVRKNKLSYDRGRQLIDTGCQVSLHSSSASADPSECEDDVYRTSQIEAVPLKGSSDGGRGMFSSLPARSRTEAKKPTTGPNSQSKSLPRDAHREMSVVVQNAVQNNQFGGNIYGSLDRKLRMLNVGEGVPSPGERRRTVQASNDLHDYAEIYTPSKETAGLLCREEDKDAKPPTPPLHRFPSWESKIYEVAVGGISASCDSLEVTSRETNEKNQYPTGSKSAIEPFVNGAFTDLNIPVYATVKGRASQIRSVPFTGESTDSSDNEDARVTITTTSSHTTSGETESSASTGSPGRGGKTSLTPSPAKHSCVSPTKSVKRDTSTESVLSDDYAIPPDALQSDAYSVDSIEPHSLRTSTTVDVTKRESLEKSGYLTKLGGKLKTWRRRWFLLKNGVLSYYKTQNDVNRKPQGQIILDEMCRVNRAEGAATFEICTSKRTFYLTADSNSTMEEWIRVLQNVIRRATAHLALNKEENKPTIEGWLTKVKHGHSRKCWCVLMGRMFLYFKTPNETKPLGQINMRDARVEEVLHVSDSDEEEQDDAMSKSEYTVGIFPNQQGPTYLIMAGKQEMDAWLYHLTVVSCGDNLAGTQYEQLIARLMEVDGDENSVVWRHPLLLYSKDSITQSLTTLPSEQLQAEAVKLFKSIQLFISVPLDTSGIDYHVALAQNALHQCLPHTELQNEMLCQLIKQTSRHSYQKPGVQQLLLCATQSLFLCDTSEKTSPTSTTSHEKPPPPESKLNPPPFVFVQGWQLLALAICLFIPKNRTLWYLRTHLQRNADHRTEAGKYAIFCQRALERAQINGGRECKPSRMEVLSILLKNPFHHSRPHSIPVHFLNGTYQVVGFDGSTTVEEFIQTINEEAGIRDSSQSGFALFSDDPIDKAMEHCLQNNAKLGDVISKWEQALREKHLGKFESTRVVKLTYKNRLCFRQLLKAETDKERLLTAYQINEDVVHGRFPLSKELALELAALMAQIEYGDYNGDKVRGSVGSATPQQHLKQVIEKFYPQKYLHSKLDKPILDNAREKWVSLRGRSVMDCVRIYLNCARRWSFCGAKLFSAKTQLKSMEVTTVWLAVTEECVALLDYATMHPAVRYPYHLIITFGGCRDDFMLVVSQPETETSFKEGHTTERLLFSMPKPKILEITLLIADYMNAIGKLPIAASPQTSTLTRLEKIRAKFRATTGPESAPTTMSSAGMKSADCLDLSKMVAEQRANFKKRAGSADCT